MLAVEVLGHAPDIIGQGLVAIARPVVHRTLLCPRSLS